MLTLIRRIFRRNSKLSDLVRTKSRVSYPPRGFHRGMVILNLANQKYVKDGKIIDD
jgi:hypothetical protein